MAGAIAARSTFHRHPRLVNPIWDDRLSPANGKFPELGYQRRPTHSRPSPNFVIPDAALAERGDPGPSSPGLDAAVRCRHPRRARLNLADGDAGLLDRGLDYGESTKRRTLCRCEEPGCWVPDLRALTSAPSGMTTIGARAEVSALHPISEIQNDRLWAVSRRAFDRWPLFWAGTKRQNTKAPRGGARPERTYFGPYITRCRATQMQAVAVPYVTPSHAATGVPTISIHAPPATAPRTMRTRYRAPTDAKFTDANARLRRVEPPIVNMKLIKTKLAMGRHSERRPPDATCHAVVQIRLANIGAPSQTLKPRIAFIRQA